MKLQSERNTKHFHGEDALLAGYFVAAHPDRDSFFGTIRKADAAGLDVFEIGYPSADAFLDGPVIRNAHERNVGSVAYREAAFWRELRSATDKPLWIMAYRKDFLDTGVYRELAASGAADGFVLPDSSVEERVRIAEEVAIHGVDVLGMVNAAMSKAEIDANIQAFGIVYLQLQLGKTGAKSERTHGFRFLLDYIRSCGGTFCMGGFGLSDAAQVSDIVGLGIDGAIVGTEFVRLQEENPDALGTLIRAMKEATRATARHAQGA